MGNKKFSLNISLLISFFLFFSLLIPNFSPLNAASPQKKLTEIQKQLKLKNDELTENRRMEFRIGVNLGDVVYDRENIYGDGVNIAARVESLADGGGCLQDCQSGTLGISFLCPPNLKNSLNYKEGISND